MASRMYCVSCKGIHDSCRFGAGLLCVNGDACRNPHCRRGAAVVGLCDGCGGIVSAEDDYRPVRSGSRIYHRHCQPAA